MRLYLLTQDKNSDSLVCAAPSKKAAQLIHPQGPQWKWNGKGWVTQMAGMTIPDGDIWPSPSKVTVRYIGEAASDIQEPCVLCASYTEDQE